MESVTQTVLILMVISDLLMAAALWFARAGRLRDGLAQWIYALGTAAACWLLMALSGHIPAFFAALVSSVLGGASLMLQTSALYAFHHRRAPKWLWLQPVIVAIAFYPLLDNMLARVIVGDMIFGATNLALGLGIARITNTPPRARGVLAGSFMLPGILLLLHAAVITLRPQVFGVVPVEWILFTIIYASTLSASFAFLLMHQERTAAETQLLATVDSLTGVFNRRSFFELAEREFARAQRANAPLSLLLLDLDHFKEVNDSYGHLAGDRVLVAFAQLLRECLRQEDLLMRYGGEEFGVLGTDVDGAMAQQLAERIRTQTEQMRVQFEGHAIGITVSIGIATRHHHDTISIDALLAHADQALYLAKNRGRNRIMTYTGASNDPPQQQYQSLLHQPAA